MKICEIYYSLQGEGPNIGKKTHFLRLTGCNLNCPYCDSTYCLKKGKEYSIINLFELLRDDRYITITGGEPLLQIEELKELLSQLNMVKCVEIQTNGTLEIFNDFKNVIWAMDIKTPSSKGYFLEKNLELITKKDWINFVIGNVEDFEFAKDFIKEHTISTKNIYFTPSYNKMSLKVLADWILKSEVNVRLGFQLHKIIWGEKRGI